MLTATAQAPQKARSSSLPPAHRKATDHLYLRGTVYYFRYAFPKRLREKFGQTEIRISLRTGLLHQARKLSRRLWSRLEEEVMPDRQRTLDEIKEFLVKEWEENFKAAAPCVFVGEPAPDFEHPENMTFFKAISAAEKTATSEPAPYVSMSILKDYIAKELDRLFPEFPNRTSLPISEIKQRMDRLRQIELDAIDEALYEVGNEIFINDEPGLYHHPVPLYLSWEYKKFLAPLTNNPVKQISVYFPNVLEELVANGLFTPCDFTPDSVIHILNEYHKVRISINRIHLHRDKGEFAYERKFTPTSTKIDLQPQMTVTKQPQRRMLLSEFIAIFIDTKIKDRKWELRSVPVHKNRIDVLLDVLGDISICDIDRAKMREFREILVQLPPNRSKDKKYKNKSIAEIIAMRPNKTLSIGTIDTTLTTISGMFEWGIKEGLLEKNPAKDLVLADPEQDIDKKDALSEEDIRTIFLMEIINLSTSKIQRTIGFH